MRWNATQLTLFVAGLSLAGTAGCQSTGARFLSLIGVQEKPLVVALVADRTKGPLAIVNPFGPYEALQAVLREELDCPVPLDLCYPLQLESSLGSGICHLAVVSTGQYAGLPNRERFMVVAVPVDEQGRVARPALLVVAARSAIESVEDLRGKTVAFGPAYDARTHQAGLELLARHGLKKTDLSLELLPLAGALKHMPNMRAVAQTVINASSDAGFIDEAAWEALPEKSADGEEPARDRLRVVARTLAVPDRLILASPTLAEATVEKVRAALMLVERDHPDALTALHISGYRPPSDELLAVCGRLAEPQGAVDESTEQGGP